MTITACVYAGITGKSSASRCTRTALGCLYVVLIHFRCRWVFICHGLSINDQRPQLYIVSSNHRIKYVRFRSRTCASRHVVVQRRIRPFSFLHHLDIHVYDDPGDYCSVSPCTRHLEMVLLTCKNCSGHQIYRSSL